MIVIDASVLAPVLLSFDEADMRLRKSIQQHEMAAPSHINLEVMSVLRKYCRRKVITEERAALALFDLYEFPVERVPSAALEPRIWELRHNLTSYDAAYVALAERFGADLWTFDRRLANAPGTDCVITVPET
ncbi:MULTISPECIES: type II toxin-antitoxin system VapC family toxin [Glycomyces]|uniref:Ribonuclease VapC n=2 Tax=Glycomyces TaxID=58113 RepID=A0A9X3PIL3_9ACTN|nr:type II toxin-antitoxin system VapC family toxin [Glycomyces lechevalierae]MDA1384694.1 type II toxin-antitoxin system VapC family toxin [Glycomyces lechevalierae]MDR7337853.1 putative nucleic acid-binding protein [Glycomyces lechevalierae]